MMAHKASSESRFALFYGNRGFFPAALMEGAQKELPKVLADMGHETISIAPGLTRYDAVETPEEGRKFARFLHEHKGEYDGVILCLPNFGDETGAVAALEEAGTPILIHAYPDELDKMGPALRRDSFCGKLSIMDVFHQHNTPFTARPPHVVSPGSPRFRENIEYFDRVCRVVRAARGMNVGAIGARTTPFKTVRIDELALQRHGINTETLDLADVFLRMRSVDPAGSEYAERKQALMASADFGGVPAASQDNLVRLAVVLAAIAEEYALDAMSIRCWLEMQNELSISPCVVNGMMMEAGLPVACEVDTGSAVMMHLLGQSTGSPTAILDWNNNYAEDDEKCILFHCGNAPRSMMVKKGVVGDHAILMNSLGPGKGWGCNQGRFAASPFTFGDLMTEDGQVKVYLGHAEFTADPIPEDFFGVAGVAHIPGLQEVLLHIGREGHRHHVALTPGHVLEPVREALESYLGFSVSVPQQP